MQTKSFFQVCFIFGNERAGCQIEASLSYLTQSPSKKVESEHVTCQCHDRSNSDLGACMQLFVPYIPLRGFFSHVGTGSKGVNVSYLKAICAVLCIIVWSA